MSALIFTYEKDPSTLPILLKYFTHKNLPKEAKDALDKINQELEAQHIMDKNIGESFKIKRYEKKIKSPLVEIMEKELRAYAENNKTDIEKTYQSVNSKAKKIMISEKVMNMSPYPFVISVIVFFIGAIACAPPPRYARRAGYVHDSTAETYVMVIVLSLIAMSFVIAGIAYLVNEHYKQSFLKEMENFIEEPRHMDKATNTENGEEPKQVGKPKQQEKEQEVEENLIDLSDNYEMNYKVEPSAPPYDEPKQPGLYPDLSKEDLQHLQPSSNFYSVLPPFNTVRGVI
ncbi:hypothetical protein [Wolbachia endosymbiont of Aedes albopictus]|uniref:hypothetical protein n=1 Tax=Wolbachia endosymbiont of Aedes albopictus TaxID=167957 RepID=UPI000BBCB857|nr:hypothetical protein [Wolbachia endosymbiont of Aedes albopictus]UVW84366.1 hypothetical protein NHG98_02580 [Wolbachia endosymbiont of Aedes albopictus]